MGQGGAPGDSAGIGGCKLGARLRNGEKAGGGAPRRRFFAAAAACARRPQGGRARRRTARGEQERPEGGGRGGVFSPPPRRAPAGPKAKGQTKSSQGREPAGSAGSCGPKGPQRDRKRGGESPQRVKGRTRKPQTQHGTATQKEKQRRQKKGGGRGRAERPHAARVGARGWAVLPGSRESPAAKGQPVVAWVVGLVRAGQHGDKARAPW